MPARNLRQAAFLIIRRKAAASRTQPALFAGFGALIGYLWIKDSFPLALKAFMFLFPYLFLFLSQDVFRDEIDSGALENAVFVNGGFREYLITKMLILAVAGVTAGSALFGVFAACGLMIDRTQITIGHLGQFFAGVLAGLYYLVVGGYLSFFFKAGSNVLVVILGQLSLATALFLSMTARRGWVEAILSGAFPGFFAKLRFLGLALLFPNAVIVRRHAFFVCGLALAGLGLFLLVRKRIKRLELSRR